MYGIINGGIDRLKNESIDLQRRGEYCGRTAERNADDADWLVGVFATCEFNSGTGIMFLQVSNGDCLPRALSMGLQINHHRRVSAVMEHSGSFQHRQP